MYKLFINTPGMMLKNILIGTVPIEYDYTISKRAKNLRLSVTMDGGVGLIVPSFIREEVAIKFLQSRSSWILSKLAYFRKNVRTSVIPQNGKTQKQNYVLYKKAALIMCKERLAFFNQHYQLNYGKITIRNQKARWGSCSKKGNLNFNFKIVFLPLHLADYIIVHELCHLKEFNHAKKFWNLVAETMPNYLKCRNELRALT